MSDSGRGPVAIITARGGSKGLPRKNVLPLAGKPLICHTIKAAVSCRLLGAVYVTTDDDEIAGVSRSAGALVIERPAPLAQDDTGSRAVVLHALQRIEARRLCESFVLLQPTSPLRTTAHIEACVKRFFGGDYGCAISVCEAEHHPSRFLALGPDGCLSPWGPPDELNAPRQQLRKAYRQNGAIYLMRTRDFRERTESFFLAPAMAFVMTQEESVDIDSPLDFRVAEMLMGRS